MRLCSFVSLRLLASGLALGVERWNVRCSSLPSPLCALPFCLLTLSILILLQRLYLLLRPGCNFGKVGRLFCLKLLKLSYCGL